MNEIDKKLYELFYDGFDWYINWDYPPELHDVFRVAKDRNESCTVESNEMTSTSFIRIGTGKINIIPYNPTLSLMNQSIETKQAIVDLFSN